MRLFRQLELPFRGTDILAVGPPGVPPGRSTDRRPVGLTAETAVPRRSGQDAGLERKARELLLANSAGRIASEVRVEWNTRLKSCAGRADYRRKLILLNPRLHEHGSAEIDRTFRHELAHLLAQFRAGRRRILPHGNEWREACQDLGIGDETRCHNLPFATKVYLPRYVYRCPNCKEESPRARRIRRR